MRSAAAVLLMPLLAAAVAPARPRAPVPPADELVLDIRDPVVTVAIAGVPLRLAVSLDTRDTVELDPQAAARLPLAWEARGAIEVGRVILPGREAHAEGEIGGRRVAIVLTTHDRPCCAGADGEIGPEQLPYGRIRFVRPGGSGAMTRAVPRRLPASVSPRAGLVATAGDGADAIMIKFAFARADTVATAAAAAILAGRLGGAWTGAARSMTLALGVARPVRALRLGSPAMLAGFAVDTLLVRTADFRGGRIMPGDPAPPADLVVTARSRPSQHDWPAVSLGRDVLDRCAEIAVERVPALVIETRCLPPPSPH